MIKFIRFISAVLFCISLFSCSYPQACYDNLKGVFSFENGNSGEALLSFRKAASETENNSEYVYYNISRLYRDMGETVASSGILDTLTGQDDKKLEYKINYLKAVIAYNEGRYEDAVLFFKNSIKIDNSDIELIKGVELSFKQLENRRGSVKKSADNKGSVSTRSPENNFKEYNYSGNSSGTQSAGKSVSENVLDLIFTEEVRLCPGDRNTEQENISDW